MKKMCCNCGEPMNRHLHAGKIRVCVAPVPDGETRESWIGVLVVRLQERAAKQEAR